MNLKKRRTNVFMNSFSYTILLKVKTDIEKLKRNIKLMFPNEFFDFN
jgi:hypothetical protein